ncbi:CHAT domain-containing protein [Mycena capillaripes]|nr:CHAT domain-containing protein [Mycena capillaripes]
MKLVTDRNDLLGEIRKQPGHKYFLLPKPCSELCQASQWGPVVILNSHEYTCDAIIILTPMFDPVKVPLAVSLDSLKFQRKALKELLNRCHVRFRGDSREGEPSRLFGKREGIISKTSDECFKDLLTWLWTEVISPIYQVLELNGICNGRLWWLLTGVFAGLPLHACSPTSNFIHSYTASLGSLLEAHSKKSARSTAKVGVVGVTKTGPTGRNYLPGVRQEVTKILSIIPKSQVECLEGQQATVDAVTRQLQDCSWLHLACHGKQDLVEPIKSHLLLYAGELELDTILRMPLSNAEVVFLAACQTAMGDSQLANESFHLGGGFIAAGFRGAIGTLWSMNDQDGPMVAEIVYSHLFRDGRQPQVSDAAEALHLAVEELRKRKVPYERWIPFIHLGI